MQHMPAEYLDLYTPLFQAAKLLDMNPCQVKEAVKAYKGTFARMGGQDMYYIPDLLKIRKSLDVARAGAIQAEKVRNEVKAQIEASRYARAQNPSIPTGEQAA